MGRAWSLIILLFIRFVFVDTLISCTIVYVMLLNRFFGADIRSALVVRIFEWNLELINQNPDGIHEKFRKCCLKNYNFRNYLSQIDICLHGIFFLYFQRFRLRIWKYTSKTYKKRKCKFTNNFLWQISIAFIHTCNCKFFILKSSIHIAFLMLHFWLILWFWQRMIFMYN